jgi:hypothetical protein
MNQQTLSTAAQAALAKYGQLTILAAFLRHADGEGANTVAQTLSTGTGAAMRNTAAADAAINAGRELAVVLKETGGLGYREGGEASSFTGSGVDVMRAAVIASGLRFYAKTGMKPNRAYTPRAMIEAAQSMTGRKYKARDYERAAADLSELCQVLKRVIA